MREKPPLVFPTPDEAVLGILAAVAKSDQDRSNEEDDRLFRLTQDLGLPEKERMEMHLRIEKIRLHHPWEAIIDAAVPACTPELRPVAFLHAVELVMADGKSAPEEKRALGYLMKAIGMPREEAEAIIRVLRMRGAWAAARRR